MMTTTEIRLAINNRYQRSAWARGVAAYALELLDNLDPAEGYTDNSHTREELLNGAEDREQYSWGGCSLIYDGDIAERVCTPSELQRTRNGERRPNAREEWLDVQARALCQACWMICGILRNGQ